MYLLNVKALRCIICELQVQIIGELAFPHTESFMKPDQFLWSDPFTWVCWAIEGVCDVPANF